MPSKCQDLMTWAWIEYPLLKILKCVLTCCKCLLLAVEMRFNVYIYYNGDLFLLCIHN